MNSLYRLTALLFVLFLAGCTSFAYQNKPLDPQGEGEARASLNIARDRGDDGVLTVLALSGGGSRAAYFSASVMLQLQQIFASGPAPNVDILSRVDAISAVSGGTLPAAYYSISRDPGSTDKVASNREWSPQTVRELMSRNYLARWIGNWFWPDNILLYWFTSYDRSDVMAQTLADNLYDIYPTGMDLRMRDLNPTRPYLILNATNGTEKVDVDNVPFGSVFSFTKEDFRDKIKSDIGSYPLANAVMASAAFPTVFNYVTLRDHGRQEGKKRYLHVFDGGNADNLGLTSVKRILFETEMTRKVPYRKIVVILVDAFINSRGVDRDNADARGPLDYVVNLNVIDAVDSLLEANRDRLLKEFKDGEFVVGGNAPDCRKQNLPKTICEMDDGKLRRIAASISDKLVFKHVHLSDGKLDPSLIQKLNKIKTSFRIAEDETGVSMTRWLDQAAQTLVNEQDPCLRHIRDILLNRAEARADDGRRVCR